MWMLLLSLALAGVPDETWLAVEGQKVVLVNPAGKQIRGTIVGYEGDRVKIERESDGRMVVVLKHEVASVVLVETTPPPEPEPPPESPEDPDSVKDAVLEVGGIVKEVGSDALDELRPEGDDEPTPVVEAEPVEESPEEVVAPNPTVPVVPIEDSVVIAPEDPITDDEGPISNTIVTDTVVETDDDAAPDSEVTEETDAPVIIDTVIVSEPDPPPPAELTVSPAPVGRTYNEGVRAGRADAADAGTLGAFAGGLCGTAVMTAVPCAFNPLLGCVTGAVAGTAAPAAAYLLEPTPPYDVLPSGEEEYSRGYVDGYTRELRRRRLIMAAIGSGSGLVVGGLTGVVFYSGLQNQN